MIEQVFQASLVMLCVHFATREGNILGFLSEYIDDINYTGYRKNNYVKHVPNIIALLAKPLFNCLVCMCSVWGTGIYLYLAHVKHIPVNAFDLITFVLMTGGMNAVLSYFIRET